MLSHRPGQHLQYLRQTHGAPFDEAGDDPDVLDYPPWPRWGWWLRRGNPPGRGPTACIQRTLLHPTLRLAVISHTAPGRRSPPVSFATTERATQIPAPGIARIDEKENPAVPAAVPAPSQLSPGLQNRSQQHIIRPNQRSHRATAIPVNVEPKVRLDLDCKKPRFWLWILTSVKAPLFYWNASELSR